MKRGGFNWGRSALADRWHPATFIFRVKESPMRKHSTEFEQGDRMRRWARRVRVAAHHINRYHVPLLILVLMATALKLFGGRLAAELAISGHVAYCAIYSVEALALLFLAVGSHLRRRSDPSMPCDHFKVSEELADFIAEESLGKVKLDFIGAHEVARAASIAQNAFAAISKPDLGKRRSIYEAWYARCPRFFSYIYPAWGGDADALPLGFVSLLPLSDSAAAEVLRGERSTFDLRGEDIEPRAADRPSYVLIQALYLHRGARVRADLAIAAVAHRVRPFMGTDGTNRPILLAEGASPNGQRLLRKLGFAQKSRARTGHPLFELDLRRIEEFRNPGKRHFYRTLLDALLRIPIGPPAKAAPPLKLPPLQPSSGNRAA